MLSKTINLESQYVPFFTKKNLHILASKIQYNTHIKLKKNSNCLVIHSQNIDSLNSTYISILDELLSIKKSCR